MLALGHTTDSNEVNAGAQRPADSALHLALAVEVQWVTVVEDGEMEQLVVPPLVLEKLFKAEVSNHMRTLMPSLVVDQES
jgi:ABC-type transport system involved in cytochrome c biogenesis permease component